MTSCTYDMHSLNEKSMKIINVYLWNNSEEKNRIFFANKEDDQDVQEVFITFTRKIIFINMFFDELRKYHTRPLRLNWALKMYILEKGIFGT